MGSARGGVYLRLTVTVSVPIAALLLARIPLPGVDTSLMERLLAGAPVSFDPAMFGIFALELNQVISAVLLVEFFAVLVPRWRPLRLGGYPERERLWARAKIVALVLVLIQAFFMVRWMRRTPDLAPHLLAGMIEGPRNDPFMIGVQTLSLVGGVFLLLWLARLIDTRGAGNGFSVMIVALAVPRVAQSLVTAWQRVQLGEERALLPLLLAAVAVAAVTRLAGGRPLRPHAAPVGRDELPRPSSGLQPILASLSPLGLLATFCLDLLPNDWFPSETWSRAVQAALIAGFCLLATWLFNRPRAVEEAWRRAGAADADAAQMRDRVRAAFARSLAWSLAICWGLMAAEWMCADAWLKISLVELTMLACVVMDVVGELRFRHAHGAVAGVWPVHRLYTLPGILKALAAAGIPAFPRGRHYRTLWNFFAPMVPVDILVPVEHANRAEAILVPLAGSARSP